jgi:hypothetical protein
MVLLYGVGGINSFLNYNFLINVMLETRILYLARLVQCHRHSQSRCPNEIDLQLLCRPITTILNLFILLR